MSSVVQLYIPTFVEALGTGDAMPRWMMCSNEKTRSSRAFSLLFYEPLLIIVHRDIGSLLDHIDQNMKNELVSSRIAVMGGSCAYPTYLNLLPHPSLLITLGLQTVATWSM
jgi:hypothetical protein